ncbi:MAG: LptA/OstA family protein, partial [Puniceicoccales bacterium]|nr:LptA/OstA family protein [Puniceicoccales bacterium]
ILMLPLGAFASPVQITSESLELWTWGPDVHMHFSHNAYIDGNNFSLKGDHIQVTIPNGSQSKPNLSVVKEIHALGNATFQWASYGGKADQISIDPSKNFILLEGNAEMWDEDSRTMSGQTLILDLKRKRIEPKGSEFEQPIISVSDISTFEQNIMLIK